MRKLILGLSILTGAYMLADGIHVLATGKYIGPAIPGPWALLLGHLGIDVFKLGPLFIVFGLAWLVFVYALLSTRSWASRYGILLAILTLWYLPGGTIVSLVTLIFHRKIIAPSQS